MSQSKLAPLCLAVVVCSALFAPGCKKGAEGDAPAKANADGPVKVKATFERFNGDYDHALYVKRNDGSADVGGTLVIARGCPSLACEDLDSFGNGQDGWKTRCPNSTLLVADFPKRGNAKPGDNDVMVRLDAPHEGGTLTGPKELPKLTIAEQGADTVTGSLDVKTDHETYATGPFKAKVCAKGAY